MLWIEMSRNESRLRDRTEWGLGRSLYTRSRKTDGSRWAFWENLLQVEKGDVILHLFGSDEPAFVGFL